MQNSKNLSKLLQFKAGSTQYELIDYSNNSIRSVENNNWLILQSKVKHLNMNFNMQFNVKPNESFLQSVLSIFTCKYCGLEEIYIETFKLLPELEVLDLSFNKIKTIHQDSFASNNKLKSLALAGNKLTSIPSHLIMGLISIQKIDLTDNQIIMKDEQFLNSVYLKEFYCVKCQITNIGSNTFKDMTGLQKLDLSFNKLVNIPENAFETNMHLKQLKIENNNLKIFPIKIFEHLPELRELCLDDNNFTTGDELTELITIYNQKVWRDPGCVNKDFTHFFETQYNITKPPTTDMPVINKGISDFFIGTYLTLIIAIQAVAFVCLSIYLIKIVNFEKVDDQFDYSTTILNGNDLYKAFKDED